MSKTASFQPSTPSPEAIAEMLTEWIDPITDEPPGTHYRLYSTPSRGANTQGSYLIYLPPAYEQNSAQRFPVLYWLHGGFGNARQGGWVVQHYDTAILKKSMPETIIVLVQALPVGWYVDSRDGKLPIEQVIIKDLIPHIDGNYRTIARTSGRGIEGHSMGGYGALHLGLKHPYLFGAISAVAPSILRNLGDEPLYRTCYTFDNDQSYYEQVGPWNLSKLNATSLREEKTNLRILSGAHDWHLQPILHEYDQWLKELNIEHLFIEVEEAGHDYQNILERYGDANFNFWANVFGDLTPLAQKA
jgi:enterochelin esterase-like enzyme